MRYLTYPERQSWGPLKAGDVVLAKDLHHGQDVVFLLLRASTGDFNYGPPQAAWECLILHSDCDELPSGKVCAPAEDFLETGERLA